MSESIQFTLDSREIEAAPGQTIIEAADAAGLYIPRLCHKPGLTPFGGCRLCTVKANGRTVSACTYPVSPGMVVESDTLELNAHRKLLLELLFVEGNHFCMSCEKSGNCELQALAYRFGISAPKYPYLFPKRELHASHPSILIDRNRCILCGRCVRASKEHDGKHVFDFVGRGHGKRLAFDAEHGLGGTGGAVTDRAIEACPTGSLLVKRRGFTVPVGRRRFDRLPIGSDVEKPTEGE